MYAHDVNRYEYSISNRDPSHKSSESSLLINWKGNIIHFPFLVFKSQTMMRIMMKRFATGPETKRTGSRYDMYMYEDVWESFKVENWRGHVKRQWHDMSTAQSHTTHAGITVIRQCICVLIPSLPNCAKASTQNQEGWKFIFSWVYVYM